MSYKKKVVYEIPIQEPGFGSEVKYTENEEKPEEALIQINTDSGNTMNIPARLIVKIAEAAKEIRPEFGMDVE